MLKQLLNLGTAGLQEEAQIKRAVFINKLNLALAALILSIGTVFVVFYFSLFLIIPIIIEFSMTVLALWLCSRKEFDRAALTTYISQCSACLYFGSLLGNFVELLPMVLFLISIIYLLFPQEQNRTRQFCFWLSILSFIFLEAVNQFGWADPLPIDPQTRLIFRELALGGILLLIVLVSKPYVTSNDSVRKLTQAHRNNRLYVNQVTHDLKSPLALCRQVANMLKTKVANNALVGREVDQLSAMMLKVTDNANDLINKALSFSEIEDGKMEYPVLRMVMVEEYFTDIVNTYQLAANRKNIKISLFLGTDMPETLKIDPVQVSQILINLLTNAIKYARENSYIIVRLDVFRTEWQMKVTNEGVGIQPEIRDRLFEPFVKGRHECDEIGNGLGLFIVHAKVRSMNGNISFESVPNELTSFTVTLPLYKAKNAPAANFSFLPEEPDTINKLEDNPTILLVDDDKIQSRWLENDLRILGCQVSIATSIEKAYQELEQWQPDVILLDSFSPKFSEALDFVKTMRGSLKYNSIPIIVVSGNLFRESKEMFIHAGVDGLLEKPLRLSMLRNMIEQQLRLIK
jgi:signal transduction histidine kinase/CheY-like chemotaxis protein